VIYVMYYNYSDSTYQINPVG